MSFCPAAFQVPNVSIPCEPLSNPDVPSLSDSKPEINIKKNKDAECKVDIITADDIAKCKNEIKTLKLKVKRLQKENDKKNQKLQDLQSKLDKQHHLSVLIKDIVHDAESNDQKAMFLLDQINNYKKKKPRWTENTIRCCLAWRIASPKGYSHCNSGILKLPARSTLSRYLGKGQEVTDLIEARLKAEAISLQPVERICSLIIDDMSIKEKMYYGRAEDRFFGLETICETDKIKKKAVVANKMLCYVVHGLSKKFTIPAAYFFHKKLQGSDFLNLTLNVLRLLQSCGFTVLRIVTDNHKSNVGLFKLLAGNNSLQTCIPHPIEQRIPIFLSFDYTHVIKNLRSIFLDHDMHSEEGVISANYIKRLFEMQKNLIIKPVRFLTRKHIYPSNLEKMNVKRAVEVFAPSVTASLEYLRKHQHPNFENSEATIKFMEMMYMFFKTHDVSDRVQHIKQCDQNAAPYLNIDDERLTWMSKFLPAYIDSIQKFSKKHKMSGLTKDTAEAMKFTAQSTAQCVKYLLQDSGFYYVLTRSFSSDAVESMFSCVRLKGGCQDATDARAAHYAIKRIVQSGLVATSTSANVFADCSYFSKVSIKPSVNVAAATTEANVDLPEHILKQIDELSDISNNRIFPGIESGSMAFLAGYICHTIEEKLECKFCMDSLLTTTKSTPLLDLIHQYRAILEKP